MQANARELEDEALRSGGVIDAEKLQAVQRLSSLVELTSATQSAPPRRRWPLIAAFTATLLIVSILLFTGPKGTGIELDFHVDQISFALIHRQMLTGPLSLSSLGLSGIGRVDIPRAKNAEAATVVAGRDFDSGLSFTAAGDAKSPGQVTLSEVVLPATTRLTLKRAEAPRQFRLTIPSSGLNPGIAVNGTIQISAINGKEHTLDFMSPKSISLRPDSPQIDLDMTFLHIPQNISTMPLAIQDLSFLRIEDRHAMDGVPARRVSTIHSGVIYLEDLNGKKVLLRSGEMFELEGSQGQLEFLQLKDDIVVRFRGRVSGITFGPQEVRRSLMPTWLEWLKARQGLSLLWGTAIYLFGLAAGLLRWLKAPE
ncbi:MAG: hypothetical protein M3N41_09150 [Acidobacteriota bacterium]|nr:hypothetical protein [Acidobacteriota bacterium]